VEKILIIDFCNYIDFQMGGYLTFAKNLIDVFGEQLSLVGITTEKNEPVGKWFKKKIQDKTFDYFALARYNKSRTKNLIPDRLKCYLLLRYYQKKIISKGFVNVMVQRQEILPAIKGFAFKNICYRFPGVENPFKISKYYFGHYFSSFFDRIFFSSFDIVSTILASADDQAINEMIIRSRGKIDKSDVIQFPTRINTDIFRPRNKRNVRQMLDMPQEKTIIINTGRLTALKGWKFMIDAYILFEKRTPDSLFYIVGEGEDYQKIKDYISSNGLAEKVILTGKKSPCDVSLLLNASDLFIMGSYKEGWPTSLVEAVGCGIPVCVSAFSGAKQIIDEGRNGYIQTKRDSTKFADLMAVALQIKIEQVDMSLYSVCNLKNDILSYWPLQP
jgi:glycosyltransferase involved in cell wall biosynthesis